ncbi:hypothetical protein ACH5RR_020165 [Cinchona calisaya]|uniref:Phytocyanin domain-containing protein n=1 Tax=Cinchona calisaya TaxID=153742 RepID=A0ABD2ZDP4_9GENT
MILGNKAVVFFFFLMIIVCQESKAHVHKVGDSAGWTTIGHVDYKTWAATKTFQVGDIILFEYNKQFHNVVRVTHKNFNSCNSTDAYATFTSGNDSFVIQRPGHYYFICSVTGHCESGQKVDIRVPGPIPNPHTPSVPPSTLLPAPSSSPGSAYPAPAPAPSRASAFYSPKGLIMKSNFWLSTLVLLSILWY